MKHVRKIYRLKPYELSKALQKPYRDKKKQNITR